MKKKTRKIVVKGIEYQWSISNFNGDGDYGCRLTIWKDKQIFYSEWLSGYNMPSSITPEYVAMKIFKEVWRVCARKPAG